MSTAGSVPAVLQDYSQVSTGRHCDFCQLGIKRTVWYICSECYDVDCCMDCYHILTATDYPYKHLQLPEASRICHKELKNKLTPEQRKKLPQPAFSTCKLGTNNLHVWAPFSFDDLVFNESYIMLQELYRASGFSLATSKPVVELTTRDVHMLTVKMRDPRTSSADRDKITKLFIEMFRQPKQVKMLTLDGGGTRGYLTIRVLEEIFRTHTSILNELKRRDLSISLEPDHDYINKTAYLAAQKFFMSQFDMIVGTSTGGLIGFCLAIDYPLYKLREIYSTPAKYFIKNSNWIPFISEFPVTNARYDAHLIEDEILKIITDHILNLPYNNTTAKQAKHITLKQAKDKFAIGRQLVINTFDMGHNRMTNFNTDYEPHLRHGLFDILRGTMAGPLYFTPHIPVVPIAPIGDGAKSSLYVDGGVFANDPTLIALYMAHLKTDHTPSTQYIVLGVGTGVNHNTYTSIGDGGLKSWITGNSSPVVSAGLLPNTLIEANRSFVETIASDLSRSPNVRRFKYNVLLPFDALLDDQQFPQKIDPFWKDIQKSIDMNSMMQFITKYFFTQQPHTGAGGGPGTGAVPIIFSAI